MRSFMAALASLALSRVDERASVCPWERARPLDRFAAPRLAWSSNLPFNEVQAASPT